MSVSLNENLDTGTSVYQELSPEGWAIVYLLGEAIPERSDVFEKLVEKPWLSDDVTSNELSALRHLDTDATGDGLTAP